MNTPDPGARRDTPADPLPPPVCDVIASIVDAVRAGDDAHTDRLLDRFVRVATPDSLYELRQQLDHGVGSQ